MNRGEDLLLTLTFLSFFLCLIGRVVAAVAESPLHCDRITFRLFVFKQEQEQQQKRVTITVACCCRFFFLYWSIPKLQHRRVVTQLCVCAVSDQLAKQSFPQSRTIDISLPLLRFPVQWLSSVEGFAVYFFFLFWFMCSCRLHFFFSLLVISGCCSSFPFLFSSAHISFFFFQLCIESKVRVFFF